MHLSECRALPHTIDCGLNTHLQGLCLSHQLLFLRHPGVFSNTGEKDELTPLVNHYPAKSQIILMFFKHIIIKKLHAGRKNYKHLIRREGQADAIREGDVLAYQLSQFLSLSW